MVDRKTIGKVVGAIAGLGVSGVFGYGIGSVSCEHLKEKYEAELKNKEEAINELQSKLSNITKENEKLKQEISSLESQIAAYKEQKGLEKIYLPYGVVDLGEKGKLPYEVFAEFLNKGSDEVALKDNKLTIYYNGNQVEINSTFSGTVLAEAVSKVVGVNYTGLETVMNKDLENVYVAKIHELRILNEKSGQSTTLDKIIRNSDVISKDTKFIVRFDTSQGTYQIEVTADNVKAIAYLVKAENEARDIVWKDKSAKYDLQHLQEFVQKSYDLATVETKEGDILIGLTKSYIDMEGKEKYRGVIVIPGKIIEAPGR